MYNIHQTEYSYMDTRKCGKKADKMNGKFKELIKHTEAQTCASEAGYLWSILNLYILVICTCLGFRY